MARTDTASWVIEAVPERVYQAMVDPLALSRWLPPAGMTAHFKYFDARPGGSYRPSLTDSHRSATLGKTTTDSDVVRLTSSNSSRVCGSFRPVDFVSANPAYAGTMTMTRELVAVGAATRVELRAGHVPLGISVEDHAAGLNSSLASLAPYVEHDSIGTGAADQ